MAVTQKFTNSSLISKTILSPNCNPREFNISGIVIHTMAGNMYVDNCGYMFQSAKAASSNYGIGSDGRIDLFVEEKNRAWTSGGYEADGKTVKKQNGLAGKDIDHRSVTIEVAAITSSEPFKCSDAAWNSLIKLCADICKRNNIKELKWKSDKNLTGKLDQQNMYAHRWFSAWKSCPGNYLYDNMGLIADQVNKLLGLTTNYHKYDTGKEAIKVTTPAVTDTSVSFKVGDIVQFTGGNIYPGSTSAKVSNIIKAESKVKITNIAAKAAHPYHAISQDGKGVYGWVDSSALSKIETSNSSSGSTTSKPTTTTPTNNTPINSAIVKGDIVTFTGGSVYASSESTKATLNVNKTSKVKVTIISKGTKHPYHAISQDGAGVYGWVDASSLKKVVTTTPTTVTKNTNYMVRVTSTITIRKGPGASYAATGTATPSVYTIVQESITGNSRWGKLKSGAGWVDLTQVTKYP